MNGFAVLLIFIAIVMGIIYYFTTCRKITSIQQEAKNYIEQKDFEGSSSDDDDGGAEEFGKDPSSPMSKMIRDMTVEMGESLSPESGVI